MTRLSENKGASRRAYFDMNPPASGHWTYKLCLENEHPKTGSELKGISKVPYVRMNPSDNVENLPADYIEEMSNSTGRRRKRYWLGEFLSDVEGALWTFDLIEDAKCLDVGEEGKTVVAIDPAATSGASSDETGIVVACKTSCGKYKVIADYSGRMTPRQWAKTAINAYQTHGAECMVAEVNHGGEMVGTILHDMAENDPALKSITLKTINAKKGKWVRAEPIAQLYEANEVAHAKGLDGLEDQMQTWVPHEAKGSPDRIDAAVYALQYLSTPAREFFLYMPE